MIAYTNEASPFGPTRDPLPTKERQQSPEGEFDDEDLLVVPCTAAADPADRSMSLKTMSVCPAARVGAGIWFE